VRVKGTREDVAIDFEKQVTYANGSSILMNVKVTTTDRTDGRVFTITGKQGRATDNPVTYAIDQDVRLVATDGMTANTEHATYTDSDSTVRAPGPATLGKGRIAATGIGLAYDTSRDVLTILDKAVVDIAPDEKGAGAVHVTSGTARFARREKSIRFEHDVKVVRGAQITEADTAVAFLSADEKRIEAVELHGGARIDEPGAAAGALRSLSGRDMNLKYAGDGQTLEHAVITDGAVIQVAGEAGQAGRQIAANSIDIGLAPDGSTPTALTAHERVRLTFPAEQGSGERTIRSNELTA